MLLARISGTVVGSRRSDRVSQGVYLLAEECDRRGKGSGKYHVALDTVGAGQGEIVLLSQGSSARQTEVSRETAIDAVIIGIVDLVEDESGLVYKK